jgi:hypothetical protein
MEEIRGKFDLIGMGDTDKQILSNWIEKERERSKIISLDRRN